VLLAAMNGCIPHIALGTGRLRPHLKFKIPGARIDTDPGDLYRLTIRAAAQSPISASTLSMRPPLHQLTLAALLLGSLSGCRLFTTAGDEGNGGDLSNFLPPVATDGVILEVYLVRFPYGREEESLRLWDEIDEQAIDRGVRRQLRQNGFRVGVVSGHIPRQLEELLGLKETVEQIGKPTPIEADGRPMVVQHVIHATARRGGQIDASSVYDSLPVLTTHGGEVSGRTYLKAQAKLILNATPQGDGTVKVRILPEVHHGEANQRFTSTGGGQWRLTSARPSQSFEELQIDVPLARGDMVVLGCLTDRQGSLGHAFFTGRPAGPLEQKLVIVRVVRSKRDDLFDGDAFDE
jgi:hypothetical protein